MIIIDFACCIHLGLCDLFTGHRAIVIVNVYAGSGAEWSCGGSWRMVWRSEEIPL